MRPYGLPRNHDVGSLKSSAGHHSGPGGDARSSFIEAEIAHLKARRLRRCAEFGRRCTAGSGPSGLDAANFALDLAALDASIAVLSGLAPASAR